MIFILLLAQMLMLLVIIYQTVYIYQVDIKYIQTLFQPIVN